MKTYVCYGYYFLSNNPAVVCSRKKIMRAESGVEACLHLEEFDGTEQELFDSSFEDKDSNAWVLVGVIVDISNESEEDWNSEE